MLSVRNVGASNLGQRQAIYKVKLEPLTKMIFLSEVEGREERETHPERKPSKFAELHVEDTASSLFHSCQRGLGERVMQAILPQ